MADRMVNAEKKFVWPVKRRPTDGRTIRQDDELEFTGTYFIIIGTRGERYSTLLQYKKKVAQIGICTHYIGRDRTQLLRLLIRNTRYRHIQIQKKLSIRRAAFR